MGATKFVPLKLKIRMVRCPVADPHGHRCIKAEGHDGAHRAFGKEWTHA